ncbi:hypothetical protein ACOJBO_01270 [Rhizobium beringeri]
MENRARSIAGRSFAEAPCTIAIDVGVAAAGTGAPQGDRSRGVNGYVLNTITPATDRTCLYFWAFARNYDIRNQARTHELREGRRRVQRGRSRARSPARAIETNPDHVFYNLNIDAGSMWARKLIDRMIDAGLSSRARPRSRSWPMLSILALGSKRSRRCKGCGT